MTEDLNIAESIVHLAELLPQECRDELNRPGDAYNACKRWLIKLGLHLLRDQCISELEEFGAWDDLEDQSDAELNIKYLWCAAGYEL